MFDAKDYMILDSDKNPIPATTLEWAAFNENEENQIKRYIDLTDEEQELFVSIFYECWDESFDFEKDYDIHMSSIHVNF